MNITLFESNGEHAIVLPLPPDYTHEDIITIFKWLRDNHLLVISLPSGHPVFLSNIEQN